MNVVKFRGGEEEILHTFLNLGRDTISVTRKMKQSDVL